jgi:uncharacterized membrane protein YkoI
MLKLINGLLAAACFVILASDVLAAAHDLELRHSFVAAPKDKIGLREAISIAEARVDGRAIDANLVNFGDDDQWDVKVASGGRYLRVWIDASNGKATVALPPQGSR